MSEEFELRLVNIHWNSKNRFAYINEISKGPIRITKQKDKQFTAEIPSYPTLENDLPCQFAVQCKSIFINEIVKNEREKDTVDLFPILDSKHGKWWIEKGDWRDKKYHDAPSCRHAGNFTILIGENNLHLNIIPSGFTPIEYQDLLSSFKGELWQLILDKNSTTTISKDGKGRLPGEEFQKQVSKFIKFTEQILTKPVVEIREHQEIQRIEKMRPNSRTFMELSTKGVFVKFVTGRGHKPSYNTPENKYIADIISRLILIVKNLINGAEYSRDSLIRSVDVMKKHLSLIQKDYDDIDPDKLNAEIRQEERKKTHWEQRRRAFEKFFFDIHLANINLLNHEKSIKFTVGNCKIEDDYPDSVDIWLKLAQSDNKSAVIKVPSGSCGAAFFLKNAKYEMLNVYYRKNEYKDKLNRICYVAKIEKLSSIKILTDPQEQVIYSLKKERQEYSKNNWQRPLRDDEKKQKEVEQLGIKKRQEMLNLMVQKYEERITNLNSIYKDLLLLSQKCKSLKIKTENRLDYPGTMTFIQNPSYRGAYSKYKSIKKETKFESLFDDLLNIQEFGITDQPNIYEKWCLLQIINILEDYGFIQAGEWETKLVSLISKNNYATCSFVFTHSSLSQEVELIYQPELANRKTPDFMLKIRSKTDLTTLILDAKNKNYNQASSLFNTFSEDLNNLANAKNYSESGNNAVFILHPMNKKGFLPLLPTSQNWSFYSTFGGSSIFDWEDNTDFRFGPEHMYGGVQVRPENLDNLRMILALALQYLTEDNHKIHISKGHIRETENSIFCLVCGGTDFSIKKRCDTKGEHYTCNECQHFFVKHYCRCGTRLWKHGSYWTYHDTRSTEPYNIKCPNCGGFFSEDKREENGIHFFY